MHVFVLILLFRCSTTIPNCSKNGVFIDDEDLKMLVDEGILTQTQIDYLHENYYYTDAFTDINAQNNNDQSSFSIYNVLGKLYDILSSSLHGIGCIILTSSYILLMYTAIDSAYWQIGITLFYFYIFHMILHLVPNTILSIILCIYCCTMPTITLIIYLIHPQFLNGITILTQLFTQIKQCLLIDGIPTQQYDRYDQYLVSLIPNKLFIYMIILNVITIITASIYLFTSSQYQHIQFIILCIYAFSIYSLILILSLFSVKSSKINQFLTKINIKKSKFCDLRYIYSSMAYCLVMFVICIVTNNSDVLFTVCLVFGLNTFHFSFPIFLFIDVFNLNFNQYLNTFKQLFVGDKKGSLESIKIVLGLLQKHDIKYRAYIIVYIVTNMLMLEMCIVYKLWIPMPYSAFSLFVLSFSIKTDMKWSLSIHLPITYSLFKSCFVFISVIHISPENIALWVLIIIIRSLICVIACLQITRAIYWTTITEEEWSKIQIKLNSLKLNAMTLRVIAHCLTLYFICCLLLYFSDLEENYLISWLFMIFGISYGWSLIVSIAHFLCKANYCLVFFILNMLLCLRFYVICCNLWIAKFIAFVGTFMSFALLIDGDHKLYENMITDEKESKIAIISSIMMYVSYGWYYDCNWLQLFGIVVCFKFLWSEISNKCIVLVILVIGMIVLFKTGFIFDLSFFGSEANDSSETMEFSVLQHYFRGIVHMQRDLKNEKLY